MKDTGVLRGGGQNASAGLSPIVEYVVAGAVVRRFVGALHHDADSVGAKSTRRDLSRCLLAREVDARAQLICPGAERERFARVEHLVEVALGALARPRGGELDEAPLPASVARPMCVTANHATFDPRRARIVSPSRRRSDASISRRRSKPSKSESVSSRQAAIVSAFAPAESA
ncbi:MAG: hypothetical protein ACRDRL_12660, partial [Sciscionella sp.]